MKPRRVLMASYDVPRDDRDAGARRLFDLTVFLKEAGWSIDFIAANGVGDPRHARMLQQWGVAVHGDSGFTVAPDKQRSASVVELLAQVNVFDLALFAFWPIAELYAPLLRQHCPGARIVVDSVDLHFLRDARRILHVNSGGETPPLLDQAFAAQMIGELNAYLAADAIMTVSDRETRLLGDLTGASLPIATVALCDDMRPSSLPLDERAGILLLGSYQHLPNVDALKYLCGEILPHVNERLLSRHPVQVVGNGLSESVCRTVWKSEHLRRVGWVPSVAPYFHRSRISVVPLRFGAGTKQKMVQALMSGTPTVCTSVGAEGLNLVDGKHVLLADDAATFARSIERLLQDDCLWDRLAAAGRELVMPRHSRAKVRDAFIQLVEQVLARPPKGGMPESGSRNRYIDRVTYQHHQRIIIGMRDLVAATIPPESTVAVASDGRQSFVQFGDRTAWHFPRGDDGQFRNQGFADGKAAINHLESLRSQGAEALILPDTALWMLGHYPDLKKHLAERYYLAGRDEQICHVYDLRNSAVRQEAPWNGHACPPSPTNGKPSTPTALLAAAGVDQTQPPRSTKESVHLIAFYLPQFHPIPENDRWWGPGFTEWRNVSKAQPLFAGHRQPQLPADLGFYDLRLPDTREEQAHLARRHGIHGFCYYHYWFHGKRLLERPFNDVLKSGKPDIPFCLCWANEPWSRRWDGSESDVLQPQSYSAADDIAHIRWLLEALADPRAIKIDNKPVFIVYQGRQLPDPTRTVDCWRNEVERAGLKGLYLMSVETGWDAGWDATKVGFDAKVLFQPQFSLLNTVPRLDVPNPRLCVFDYQKAWPILANPQPVSYLRYDSVFPSWDNSPRRGEEGWVVHNSTPEAYRQWLQLAIERARQRPGDQQVVFINAWNEWAEGCHLEPDRSTGSAYLEATRDALQSLRRSRGDG